MVLSKCQCGIAQLTNYLTRHTVGLKPLIVLFMAEWEGPVYSMGHFELRDNGVHIQVQLWGHEKIMKERFELYHSIGRHKDTVDFKVPKTACFYVNAEDVKNMEIVEHIEKATNPPGYENQISYKKSYLYVHVETDAQAELDKTHQ
jgi:hypothetical protein